MSTARMSVEPPQGFASAPYRSVHVAWPRLVVPLSDVLSSLLRHDLQACGSHTLRRRSPETLAILGPDGSRRSTNTACRTRPRGSSAGHSSCYRGSQGKLLGSLGRGMQADGVWAHLPATTGPIAAVPARGCPGGVAIRPGAQSAKVCAGTGDQGRRVDLGGSVSVRRMI